MTISVLLLNQDIAFIVSLKQALEQTGDFDVALATNPDAGTDALRRTRFDIAVVDFEIAGHDAVEIIRMLRKVQPTLPILMTPDTDVQRERIEFMDVQGSLMKPFNARTLIPHLIAVLNRLNAGTIPMPRTARDSRPAEPRSDRTALLIDTSEPVADTNPLPPEEDDVPRRSAAEIIAAAVDDEVGPETFDLDQLERRSATGPLPPSDADVLEEYEALERATGPVDDDEHAPRKTGGTDRLPDIEEDTGYTRLLEPLPDASDDAPQLQESDRTRQRDRPPYVESDRTQLLEMPDEPPDTTSLLEWDSRSEETHHLVSTERLAEEEKPHYPGLAGRDVDGPAALLEWAEIDAARRAAKEAEEGLTRERWELGTPKRKTKPLRRSAMDAPPATTNDIRADSADDVVDKDAFFTPDKMAEAYDAGDDFDDVLDAVARTGDDLPSDDTEIEEDKFRTLVDSLRRPGHERPRRTRLEELLDSIAEDAVEDLVPPDTPAEAVDMVLDAIRRGRSPLASADRAGMDVDATIGDVIDGLFDPEFEGVLAALSGEEVDEDAFDEPTYVRPELPSPPRLPEAMDGEDWIETDAIEGDETITSAPGAYDEWPDDAYFAPRDKGFIEEPPVTPEDSSKYPATTVLAATSEDKDGFSLDTLLSEIEDQLPPVRTRRPQLRPLPSWERDGHLEGAGTLGSIFDHVEGVRQAPLSDDEIAEAAADYGPAVFTEDIDVSAEPPVIEGDTVPSSALRAELEDFSAQDTDTVPVGPSAGVVDLFPLLDDVPLPTMDTQDDTFYPAQDAELLDEGGDILSIDEFLARADLPPEAADDEIRRDRRRSSDPARARDDDATDIFDAAELGIPIGDTGITTDDEIAAVFYDGVHEDVTGSQGVAGESVDDVPPGLPEYPPDITIGYPDAYEAEPAPVDDNTQQFASLDREIQAEYAAGYDVPFNLPSDEDHLITMPADEATQRLEAYIAEEEEQDDEEELARLAVQLTQYSLESSAQATMLSRGGELLADAGDLDEETIEALFAEVSASWRSRTDSASLMRFVSIPECGDFLLYSAALSDDMTLSMVFHADTPLRIIRRQARRIGESMALFPAFEDEDVEAPAARTMPSRPTDPIPPEGLRKAVAAEGHDLPGQRSRKDDEPRTAYTAMWLPRDPGQELLGDLARALYHWIAELADASAWDLQDVMVHEDYVSLTLDAPRKVSPATVITHLMNETAARVRQEFPRAGNGKPLWTDGYYVITPPRELTEREISRIITVQRNAQIER